jgi:hypothetical protein
MEYVNGVDCPMTGGKRRATGNGCMPGWFTVAVYANGWQPVV